MRATAQVGFWLCINDILFVARSHSLCLKRRICLCYCSSTILNFRSLPFSLSLSLHDDCKWHAFCSHVAHSGTHTINVTLIRIEASRQAHICLSRRMCLAGVNELSWCLYQNVQIDGDHTLFADIAFSDHLWCAIVKRKINFDKSIKGIDFKLVSDLKERRWQLLNGWLTESIIPLRRSTRVRWRLQVHKCIVRVHRSMMDLFFSSTDLFGWVTSFALQLPTYLTSIVSTILFNTSNLTMMSFFYLNDADQSVHHQVEGLGRCVL